MENVKNKIMQHLRDIKIAARVPKISQAIGEEERSVQAALIELDDEDMVIMSNGWYLASHKGMQA
jgi:hypothetical protein